MSSHGRRKARRAKFYCGFALLLVFNAGCGEPSAAVSNPELARSALQQSLDAWRQGATVESLQSREPAIHVNDPDWRSKKRLVQYELGPGQTHGNSWACNAVLTVQNGAKSTRTNASFTVDTQPTLVIVRNVIE